MPATPTRIATNAMVFALGCIVPLTSLPARASDTSAAERLEADRAVLRPVCADKAVRDKIVAQRIARSRLGVGRN